MTTKKVDMIWHTAIVITTTLRTYEELSKAAAISERHEGNWATEVGELKKDITFSGGTVTGAVVEEVIEGQGKPALSL